MKLFVKFTKNCIEARDAYKTQYDKLINKKGEFMGWITIPGTARTQNEHNSFWGNIGIVADILGMDYNEIYDITRIHPNCCRDVFVRDLVNSKTGEIVGDITLGLSDLDHEDMINYQVVSRMMDYWQDEVNQHFSNIFDKKITVKIYWYIHENKTRDKNLPKYEIINFS